MRIVKQLHGLDGKLSRTNMSILLALMQHANPPLWQSAKNMIIGNRPIMTLGKAVKCVTPSTLQISETPDPFTLYRAMRYCLNKQKALKYSNEVFDIEP